MIGKPRSIEAQLFQALPRSVRSKICEYDNLTKDAGRLYQRQVTLLNIPRVTDSGFVVSPSYLERKEDEAYSLKCQGRRLTQTASDVRVDIMRLADKKHIPVRDIEKVMAWVRIGKPETPAVSG